MLRNMLIMLRVYICLVVYLSNWIFNKLQEDISYIFKTADKDNSGFLTVKEFKDLIEDIRIRYPQIDLYLERQHMSNAAKLLEETAENRHGKTIQLNIEQFKTALSRVDSQMKALPATAQVIPLLLVRFIKQRHVTNNLGIYYCFVLCAGFYPKPSSAEHSKNEKQK